MNKMMLLAVVGAAFWTGCATTQKPAYDTLICHRGESHDAPENTLPAYRMAVDRGFGFECDIYLSKDKRLFTFHDGNLARTTDGAHKEKCTAASWEETVSKVNVGGWGKWKGSRFDPTRPALLEEVLAPSRTFSAAAAMRAVKKAVVKALGELAKLPVQDLVEARYAKFRAMGNFYP